MCIRDSGSGAQATQRISTAYGPNANANSAGGVAIGTDAAVGTDTGLTTVIAGATAVGANAQAQSTNGSAFGRNAKADKSAEKATALGAYATANIAGGVALGSDSVTTTAAGVKGYNPADNRTNKYSDQAGAIGTSTLAAVSVGNGLTATRQITGVAAGTADTDAVNVAQLKNVNLKYAGDSGNSDVLLKDGTLKVKGDTKLISTSADATGITVTAKVGDNITTNTDGKAVAPTTNGIATTTNVADAINASGWKANASANGGTLTGSATATKVVPGDTVTFSAGKNLTVAQTLGTNTQQYTYALSSTLKDIESIQNGTTKITLNNGGGTTISGGNLSVDGNKITNVAPGTDDTDAVNYKQLKSAKTVVKGGTNVTVDKGTGANGEDVYTVNATGGTGGAASTWNLNTGVASATEGTHSGDTTQNIADTKSVTLQAGKNLTVKQTNDGNGNTDVAYSLDSDLKDLTSVTTEKVTTKEIGLKDAAGNTTTIKKDGDRITYTNDGGTTNKTVATLDDEMHIKDTTYTVDANKKVTLTYVDGNSKDVAGKKAIIDLSGLPVGDKDTDMRIKDGNYEVSKNGTVEMTYVDGSGKQLVDEHGNPVKATISGIARQDLSNITNEGKKVITGLGTIVKAGQNVSVDEATDNATGQKTYTVNADLSGAKVYAGVGTDGSGVAKGLKNPAKVEKGTQYIAGDNMVVERKPVEGDDKLDNSITYSLSHDLTEINSISNGCLLYTSDAADE